MDDYGRRIDFNKSDFNQVSDKYVQTCSLNNNYELAQTQSVSFTLYDGIDSTFTVAFSVVQHLNQYLFAGVYFYYNINTTTYYSFKPDYDNVASGSVSTADHDWSNQIDVNKSLTCTNWDLQLDEHFHLNFDTIKYQFFFKSNSFTYGDAVKCAGCQTYVSWILVTLSLLSVKLAALF
jgi:hypothetical protein